MSPVPDDSFADLLIACDEAILAGTPLPEMPTGSDSSGLARAVDCLYRLHQLKASRTVPRTVGRFQLRRELGRGGFGVVFLAFDTRLDRDVALKLPRPDVLTSRELRERFHREARAAAGLNHPNIVPVYEAGESGPTCYIATAYCPGPTLRDWLRDRTEPVPFVEAATLTAALADAAGHAHARGIVHRDLKPANVLLGSEPNGEPKITDFGLAKLVESQEPVTRSGVVLGTPSYMAPEQAEGTKGVGPTTDVYSLGVILYELLTGRPPFVGESDLDTLRQAGSQEPVPPSRLRLRLPRDLETVCLKCLEKDPRRRYSTGTELAADLRRYLAGQPVTAWRVGPIGRAWKRARRHPVAAGLLAALVALAVVGTTAITILWRQAAASATSLSVQSQKTEAALAAKVIALARNEWEANNLDQARASLSECPMPYRDKEWRTIHRLCHSEVMPPFSFLAEAATRIEYSPDGKYLAAASRTDLQVWNMATRSEAFAAKLEKLAIVNVGFSPDGSRVIVEAPLPIPKPRSAPLGLQLLMWDTSSGRPSPDSPNHWLYGDSPKRVFATSRSGLAARVEGPVIRIFNRLIGTTSEIAHGHKDVQYLEFNATGSRLLSWAPKEPIKVWDTASGSVLYTSTSWTLRIPSLELYRQMLSPDGRCLLQSGTDARLDAFGRYPVFVRDLKDDRELARIWTGSSLLFSNRFSPDGRLLATLDGRVIRVWDLNLLREVFVFRGHDKPILDIEFSPNGRWLTSAASDNTIRVWDLSPPED
jgi:hypothetical protein